jgi:hypothetical protein
MALDYLHRAFVVPLPPRGFVLGFGKLDSAALFLGWHRNASLQRFHQPHLIGHGQVGDILMQPLPERRSIIDYRKPITIGDDSAERGDMLGANLAVNPAAPNKACVEPKTILAEANEHCSGKLARSSESTQLTSAITRTSTSPKTLCRLSAKKPHKWPGEFCTLAAMTTTPGSEPAARAAPGKQPRVNQSLKSRGAARSLYVALGKDPRARFMTPLTTLFASAQV